MKVNVEIPPPTTIKMTLEMTPEEARVLKEMFGRNASIAALVFDSTTHPKYTVARDIGADIYRAIQETATNHAYKLTNL